MRAGLSARRGSRHAPRRSARPGTPPAAAAAGRSAAISTGDVDRDAVDGRRSLARSVIYMCVHSTEGAMGIVVNQPAAHISFTDFLVQLEVVPAAELIQLPSRAGGVQVLRVDRSTPSAVSCCTRATSSSRTRPCRSTKASALRRRSTSSRRSPAARTAERDPRARLCRVGRRGSSRTRSSITAIARCAGRCRANLRPGHRRQIRAGAEEDRHRSRHALERSRARVITIRSTKVYCTTRLRGAGSLCSTGTSACSSALASSAPIGSPK